MDCFAEPVVGRRFAPTRWLAMSGRLASYHRTLKNSFSKLAASVSPTAG